MRKRTPKSPEALKALIDLSALTLSIHYLIEDLSARATALEAAIDTYADTHGFPIEDYHPAFVGDAS